MIYNTLTGAFLLLDDYHYNIYENITKNPIDTQNKEIVDSFLSNGIIVDKSIDEFLIIKTNANISKYMSSVFELTIAPTLACNMDCPYCYEKEKTGVMSQEILDNIINFTLHNIDLYGYKHLEITWYGGEPLLQLNSIRYLSLEFKKLCKEKNITYAAKMVSNGSLLNKEIAEILVDECMVKFVQITLDGLNEKNDKRRYLKNGQGSFDIITKNIKEIRDILPIRIRVNIDKDNSDDLDSLVEYYNKELDHENVSIYITPVTDENENSCTKSLCYKPKDFANIQKRFNEKMNYNFNLPQYIPLACGAMGPNTFVIGPDGDLVKCWNEIGIKDYSVGNVKNGFVLNKRALKWLNKELDEACRECKTLPICQGSCPYQTIDKNSGPVCDYSKYLIENTLNKACTYIKDNKGI